MRHAFLITSLLSLMSFGSMASTGADHKAEVAAKLTDEQTQLFEQGLVELKGTMLQFACKNEDYKIQKIMKPKPTSTMPVAVFDDNGEVVSVTQRGGFSCPEGEIDITNFCVQVVCSYTEVLSAEEAKKRVAQEQNAKSLLN